MSLEYVKELTETAENNGHTQVFLILILILIVTVLVLENFNKLKKLLGIKSMKEIHEEQQEKDIQKIEKEVESVKDEIEDIRTYSKEATKKRKEFETQVTETLSEIKEDMIDDRISRIRWEIMDFSNSCQKRQYNKEAFDHILELYSQYQWLCQKYSRVNNKVPLAIEYINKRYAEYMETGFPVY